MREKRGRGRPKVGNKYDGVLAHIAELVCARNFTARCAAQTLGAGDKHGIGWRRLYNLYVERSHDFEVRAMEIRLRPYGDGGKWRLLRQQAELDVEDIPGFKEIAEELLPRVPVHRRDSDELAELLKEARRRLPDYS